MKSKKLKLVSLLFLAALVSCGKTDKISGGTENNNNPGTSDKVSENNSNTENKSDVAPTAVSLVTKKNYLYVNEEMAITAAFEPAGSSDDYRLTSSSPDVIAVVGRKIQAKAATVKDEEVTITLTTDGGLTASAKFVVYNAIDRATELLNASHAIALTTATGGSIDINSYEDGQDDFTSSYSYNIYNNSSEVFEEIKDGKNEVKQTYYNRAIINNQYVESRRTRTGTTGAFSNVRGYLENRPIVETVTEKNYQYTMDEAKERISNVQLATNYTSGIRGMEGFIIEQFLTETSSFGSSLAKANVTMEESLSDMTDIYTLKYDYTRENSTTRVEEELTMEFDSTGLLIDVHDTLHHYEGEEGKETASYDVTCIQSGGEREDLPEGAFDFSEYFFDDFNVIFHTSMFNYDTTTSDLTYNVGDTAYLLNIDGYVGGSPKTASTYIDPIKVTAVSHPDAVEIINGNRIKFKKLVENLEVTVSSSMKSVQKKVTLHCVAPTTTKIQFGEFMNPTSSSASYSSCSSAHYLPSSWIMGTDREVWVVGEKVQQSPSITVTSSNPEVATVTMVEGSENKFTFHPVKAGKTTIKVVDKTLGEEKALTKEITVFDNSDEGIADLLKESAFVPFNQDMYSDFKFSGTKGTNKGDFFGKFGSGSSAIAIWGSWKIEDGELKVNNYSGAFGEYQYESSEFLLTDIAYSNYAKYGPTNITIKGSSRYAGDIGDGVGTGIVLY